MKRILPLILCLTLLAGIFSGCAAEDTPYVPTGNAMVNEDGSMAGGATETEAPPQELSLMFYPERSLHPYNSTDLTNRALFSLIYQSLFVVDNHYQTHPILCDRYKISEDSRTYTFYLVNATFSDGSRVTPSDVLASYTAAKESRYYAGRFTHISDFFLSEDGGICFRLDTPVEDFPMLLDIPIVKASEVEADRPIGSGPYVLEDTLTGSHLRRLPGWWCQSDVQLVVTAEIIPLIPAQSATHIRDQFQFYDVGLVCTDPCTDTYADFRSDYEVWNMDNGIFLYLGCNIAYKDIFEDTSLRSALTYAIDRQALADEFYRGFAQPTTLPASPSSPYYSKGLASKYEYDPMKFVDILSRHPLPDEPLQLLVNKDDSLRLRTARAIAKMLSDHGLPTVTLELSTHEYTSMYYGGQFDLYLGQTKLSPNMDLTPFFHPWGHLRYNGMADTTFYTLSLNALDNHGNYYNLHQAIADDGRMVPILFCSYAVYATRGLLTDLEPARDNVFFYTLGRTMKDALIPIDYTLGEG